MARVRMTRMLYVGIQRYADSSGHFTFAIAVYFNMAFTVCSFSLLLGLSSALSLVAAQVVSVTIECGSICLSTAFAGNETKACKEDDDSGSRK
ncbi:hypothetical protein V8C34DRAFT_265860 [Trichoderma compactum]